MTGAADSARKRLPGQQGSADPRRPKMRKTFAIVLAAVMGLSATPSLADPFVPAIVDQWGQLIHDAAQDPPPDCIGCVDDDPAKTPDTPDAPDADDGGDDGGSAGDSHDTPDAKQGRDWENTHGDGPF
jgi:hypothetical protein